MHLCFAVRRVECAMNTPAHVHTLNEASGTTHRLVDVFVVPKQNVEDGLEHGAHAFVLVLDVIWNLEQRHAAITHARATSNSASKDATRTTTRTTTSMAGHGQAMPEWHTHNDSMPLCHKVLGKETVHGVISAFPGAAINEEQG